MSGVSVDRLVILIAVILVAVGGAFGWSKSGLGRAGDIVRTMGWGRVRKIGHPSKQKRGAFWFGTD